VDVAPPGPRPIKNQYSVLCRDGELVSPSHKLIITENDTGSGALINFPGPILRNEDGRVSALWIDFPKPAFVVVKHPQVISVPDCRVAIKSDIPTQFVRRVFGRYPTGSDKDGILHVGLGAKLRESLPDLLTGTID